MISRKKSLMIIAIITLVVAILFAGIAFYKISAYENDDYGYDLKNAYVGGDAYNYIINGTYFSGYASLSGAFFICACASYIAMLYSDENSNQNTVSVVEEKDS